VAGIVIGSLMAPGLVSAVGLDGCLIAVGAIALGYGLQLLARGATRASRLRPARTADLNAS
jgi:hypothetical protein